MHSPVQIDQAQCRAGPCHTHNDQEKKIQQQHWIVNWCLRIAVPLADAFLPDANIASINQLFV